MNLKPQFMRGVIDRRILVNYRIDPAVAAAALPDPLRPKLVRGAAIGGICLIRLTRLRPRCVPAALGVSSENAAHRLAVVLPDGSEGVYIPRRDTSSRLSALAGGRLFPGRHHRSDFEVREAAGSYAVALRDARGDTLLSVRASLDETWPSSSVFASVHEASAFFETGALGYSPGATPSKLDGIELRTHSWSVEALRVEHVSSAYFEDTSLFPRGSATLDHALLMRDIDHEWHIREPLYCGERRCAG